MQSCPFMPIHVCWMAAYLQLRNSLEFEQQLHHLRIVPCHWGVTINHTSSVIQIGWEFRRTHTKIVPRCSRTAAWRGKYALRQALFLLKKLSIPESFFQKTLHANVRKTNKARPAQEPPLCIDVGESWAFFAKSLSAIAADNPNKSKLIAHRRPQGKSSNYCNIQISPHLSTNSFSDILLDMPQNQLSVFWVLRQATILLEPSEHLSLGLRHRDVSPTEKAPTSCVSRQRNERFMTGDAAFHHIFLLYLTGLALFLATISSISCPQVFNFGNLKDVDTWFQDLPHEVSFQQKLQKSKFLNWLITWNSFLSPNPLCVLGVCREELENFWADQKQTSRLPWCRPKLASVCADQHQTERWQVLHCPVARSVPMVRTFGKIWRDIWGDIPTGKSKDCAGVSDLN